MDVDLFQKVGDSRAFLIEVAGGDDDDTCAVTCDPERVESAVVGVNLASVVAYAVCRDADGDLMLVL